MPTSFLTSPCCWREQHRRSLGCRADSEPDPHPGCAVSGHSTEDEVLTSRLRREAHDISAFRRKSCRQLERESAWDRRADRLRWQRCLRSNHLSTMRQHPVVVAELDLCKI